MTTIRGQTLDGRQRHNRQLLADYEIEDCTFEGRSGIRTRLVQLRSQHPSNFARRRPAQSESV